MMKRIIINFILVLVFALLIMLAILPFIAELQFDQAIELEKKHNWLLAEKKFLKAANTDPFNSEYFAKYGDCLVAKSLFISGEKTSLLKNAEKLYQKAIQLNPHHAEYNYSLGKLQLDLNDRSNAFGNFKKAFKKDPFNYRNSYLIGFEMLKLWNSLDSRGKEFVLECFKVVLKTDPWYGNTVYPAILYFTKDFQLALVITPKTYFGHKILYSFLVDRQLWQYRKKIELLMDFYRQKESPELFRQERLKRGENLKAIKELFKGNEQSQGFTNKIAQEEWYGKSEDGEEKIVNGQMYFDGTIYAVVNLKRGKAKININAKKFLVIEEKNTQDPKFFPYMIVKLDGVEIGETFVKNDEWEKYSYSVNTAGGLRVLSVSFVNDIYLPEKKEDRNLFIGDANIIYE